MPRFHRFNRKHKNHRKRASSNGRRSHKKPTSGWLSMPSRAKYLPAIIISVFASFVWAQPNFAINRSAENGVLAYATNVSISGLLSATNTQRSNNGAGSLTINSKLNSAAQAKAQDMVNRNYWSHQTPDGQQPWVFITGAGYQYLSAGENLAYGFMTSSATVTGWMNSPSHRSNLLSSSFTEVGFGIANSPNFVGNGEQTVVVAMYAKPQAAPAPAPTPPAPQAPTPTPSPTTQGSSSQKPSQKPVAAAEPKTEPVEDQPEEVIEEEPIAVALAGDSEVPPPTATTTKVSRVQVMTGGSAIWSATFVILSVCAIGILWMVHRGFRFKKWFRSAEKMVGKYLYLDLTVLSIIYLGFVLLNTTGTIK